MAVAGNFAGTLEWLVGRLLDWCDRHSCNIYCRCTSIALCAYPETCKSQPHQLLQDVCLALNCHIQAEIDMLVGSFR